MLARRSSDDIKIFVSQASLTTQIAIHKSKTENSMHVLKAQDFRCIVRLAACAVPSVHFRQNEDVTRRHVEADVGLSC